MAEDRTHLNDAIWAGAQVLANSDGVVIAESVSLWASKALGADVRAHVYGSMVTGIRDASSDIDIVLDCQSIGRMDCEVLETLRSSDESLIGCRVLHYVPSARVPVLTLARHDGLVIDITVNNMLPIYNSRLLAEYCKIDDRVKPLASVVKHLCKAFGIVGAAAQNLSSYSWSLMVIFYLQVADLKFESGDSHVHNLLSLQEGAHQEIISSDGRNINVGFRKLADLEVQGIHLPFHGRLNGAFSWDKLVHGFLRFYTEEFDFDRELISPRLGKRVEATCINIAVSGSGPHIEDPFDIGHNLGAVLSDSRRQALRDSLRWGIEILSSESTFASLLEGDADLRAPVSWDSLTCAGEDLVHQCIRPAGKLLGAEFTDVMGEFMPDGSTRHYDEFQRRAAWCTSRGESVVVSAPTSSGKTAVAECAIHIALAKRRFVIFCSPIKALSNEKFLDFSVKFPGRVGLLTGDAAVPPSRDILVATTEVLRSILFRGEPLDKVLIVVFDELHFLGNKDRGNVWEETIILLPAHINIVGLSATIPNCLDLAGWICQVKHSACHMLLKRARPTPLQTYGVGDSTKLLVDGEGNFHEPNFMALEPAAGLDMLISKISLNLYLTPALVFFFRKAACYAHAVSLVANGVNQLVKLGEHILAYDARSEDRLDAERLLLRIFKSYQPECNLVRPKNAQKIRERLQQTVCEFHTEDRELPQVKMQSEMLPSGVGVHTGGLLAPLRELVEKLFAEGLLTILFCTESCAVGLNLPAKSVALSLTGLQKADGWNRRLLLPGEYNQIVGRAGRRGRDAHGNVLICVTGMTQSNHRRAKNAKEVEKQRQQDLATFKKVALSPVEAVMSRFQLRFITVLNLLKFGHRGYVTWFFMQSFHQFQTRMARLRLDEGRHIDSIFGALEQLGLVSSDQRLTALGRAAAGLWIGDPIIIVKLMQEGVFDALSMESVVAFLSVFVVEPNFHQKKEKEDAMEDEESKSNERVKDRRVNEKLEETEMTSMQEKFLQAAECITEVLQTRTLIHHSPEYGNEEHFERWQSGFLPLAGYRRIMKDGRLMMQATRLWLKGSSLSQVMTCFPLGAKIDEGTLASRLRRLSKLVQQVRRAASFLGKEDLATMLQEADERLRRGLPFMPSLLLAASTDVMEAPEKRELQCTSPGCPDEVGKVLQMRPSDIGFSHNSCSANYRDGRTVRSTLQQLLEGEVSVHEIEQLRVYWHMGMYFSLGNRRLSAFPLWEQFCEGVTVPVRVVSSQEAQEWGWTSKFTSGRWRGAVVLLRETGEIIGRSREQTVFSLRSDTQKSLSANSEPSRTHKKSNPVAFAPSVDQWQGGIGYWQHLRSACKEDEQRLVELVDVTEPFASSIKSEAKNSGPPRPLLDPLRLSDEELTRMDMDWSPCKDPNFQLPGCGVQNGKPCTRKGCTGIFEKTGEACLFCHLHTSEVIARFEAFRGFARRAAKKSVGVHRNRRMGY